MTKYIVEYRSLDVDYRLELEGDSLNEVLILFARRYAYIEKVYVVREKNFSDIISNNAYKRLSNVIKPR